MWNDKFGSEWIFFIILRMKFDISITFNNKRQGCGLSRSQQLRYINRSSIIHVTPIYIERYMVGRIMLKLAKWNDDMFLGEGMESNESQQMRQREGVW